MFEVQNLIYVYMTLCFAMMIFNLAYMFYQSSSNKKIQRRNKTLMKRIDVQMSLIKNHETILEIHKSYLYHKLRRVANLYVFEETLEFYSPELVEVYLAQVEGVFINLCDVYIKKNSIEKAYFAYLLGKYKVGKKKEILAITKYLFHMLEEGSVYCVDNAMTTFYKLGDIENIVHALFIVDKKELYQNSLVIEKGFSLYKANEEEFADILWSIKDKLSLKIKIAIISYITKLSDNTKWNDEMYELLIDSNSKIELKKAIVEYFGVHYDERVRDELYKILRLPTSKYSDYIIETIRTLKIYPGKETIAALKDILKNEQWIFQIEAAETLNYLDVNYLQLLDIYDSQHQNARDILKYVISRERKEVEAWR